MADQCEQSKSQSIVQPQIGHLYHSPQGSGIITHKKLRIIGPGLWTPYLLIMAGPLHL